MSSSYVWNLDTDTQVASLKEGLSRVCIGLEPSECNDIDGKVTGALRVKGGIQIGKHVFRTLSDGNIMVVEALDGNQIMRINLETGGVAVGEDDQVPKHGVRITGKKVKDGSRDSETWLARSNFDIYSEGSDKAYASISEVVHTTSAIAGARVCPPGPTIKPLSCIHLTPHGIVIGDATYNFIQAHASKADDLVSGTTNSNYMKQDLECTDIPLDDVELRTDLEVKYEVVEMRFEKCYSPMTLKKVTKITEGVLCDNNFVYWTNETKSAQKLGDCTFFDNDHIIYYCKVSLENK